MVAWTLPFTGYSAWEVETGDLVFRRGRSWLSRTVLAVDSPSGYSHVGIAWRQGARTLVIHAGPADGDQPAAVRIEPIEQFLDGAHAETGALFRVMGASSQAKEAAVRVVWQPPS